MLLTPTEQPESLAQLGGRLYGFTGVNGNNADDGLGALRPLGIPAPASAPTGANGAAGNVPDGVHLIYVTFVYIRSGVALVESNPSPVLSHTVAGGPVIVNLSAIPVSTHPAVNGRRIYVTAAAGSNPVQLTTAAAEILDNTTTTFAYNVTDANLTSLSLSTANQPLPTAAYGLAFGNRLIVGGAVTKVVSLIATNGSAGFTSVGGTVSEGDVGKYVVFPDNTKYLIASVAEATRTGAFSVLFQGTTATYSTLITGDSNQVTIGNPLPLNIEAYDPLADSQILVGADDGMPLRAIAPYHQTVVFGKSRAIYQLNGTLITDTATALTTGPSYSVDVLTTKVGIASHFAAQPLRGGELIFYGGDGIYRLEGSQPYKLSTLIDPLFDDTVESPILLGAEDCRVDHSLDATAHAVYNPSSQIYYLWVARKARVLPTTATATATLSGGAITTITMTSGGSGYAFQPACFVNENANTILTPTVVNGVVTGIAVSGTNSGFTTATITINAPTNVPRMLDLCIALDFKRRNSRNQPAAWAFLIPALTSRLHLDTSNGKLRFLIGNYHSKAEEMSLGWRDGLPTSAVGDTNYLYKIVSLANPTGTKSTRLMFSAATGYNGYREDTYAGTAGLPIVGTNAASKGLFRVLKSAFVPTAITLTRSDSNHFEAPASTSLNVADVFSIVAWIKRSATGVGHAIIAKPTGSYELRVAGDVLELLKTNTTSIATSSVSLADTNWHMVVVTKNGATTKMYIDGSADVAVAGTNAAIAASSAATSIGRNPSAAGEGFGGSLAEIALWNGVVLTQANAAALYAAASAGGYNVLVNSLAPSAYWRMSAPSGNVLDETINNNTMVLTGAATYGAASALTALTNTEVEIDEERSGPNPFAIGDIVTIGGHHAYWASNYNIGEAEGILKRGSRLKTTFEIPTFTSTDT